MILIFFMGWHTMFFYRGTWKRLSFFIHPREALKLVPSHVYWSYAWPNFTDLIFVLWTFDFLRKPTSSSKCKLKRQYKLQIIRQHPVRICLLHLNQSCPGTKLQNTEEWHKETISSGLSIINDAYEFKWPKFVFR